MKKLMFAFALVAGIGLTASAQTKVVEDKKTTKKTSSVPQKVHNTFSKKKEHNGTKTTHVKTVEKTVK